MNAPLETILAAVRSRLQSAYGGRLIRVALFGSHARGDAEPGSDIDIVVVLKGPIDYEVERPVYMRIAADLSLDYDTVIMPVVVDEETYRHSGLPLYRNIRRESVAV